MSQLDPDLLSGGLVQSANPPILDERLPVSSLSLLILLLIPCVVLLLLFNCVILGYKLLSWKKKRRRRRRLREQWSFFSPSTEFSRLSGTTKLSEEPSFANNAGPGRICPVSSAHSLGEKRGEPRPRGRAYKPDGTAGEASGSLRPPSTILAVLSTTASTTRADLPRRTQVHTNSSSDWRAGVHQIVPFSSDSETERPHPVPPNSPEITVQRDLPGTRQMHRSSTMRLHNERHIRIMSPPVDSVRFECASNIPCEETGFVHSGNSSTLGPGLDSDFGASAGISLRILSSDSESCSSVLWASGLEWDYYDPGYNRRKQMRKHMEQLPALCSRQYWV
ncbi:protein huluwa-like [Polyodon spathula]|uniref:protein huluwa-like n=1 Tax=Polyodon spathula TaxID=7913 RepID=UPI001B7F5CC8|nr:protein huluwa-like [Polyodon spathula]